MTAPTTHPRHSAWADPNLSITDGGATVEHRSMPLIWKVAGDDVLISVGLTRLDCLDGAHGVQPGDLKVTLTLTGDVPATDLTTCDAKMVMAALGCMVEQAEKVAAQERALAQVRSVA